MLLAALLAALLAVLAGAGCAGTDVGVEPPPPPADEPAPTPAPTPPAPMALEDLAPVPLAEPPFEETLAAPAVGATGRLPRPELVSATPNAVTDEAPWFARHDLTLPVYRISGDLPRRAPAGAGPLPEDVPRSYQGEELLRAIRGASLTLLVYGSEFGRGRYLAGVDEEGARFAFDFEAYARPPGVGGPYQEVTWAAVRGDVLYVAHSHPTYAEDSRGQTGYLTALEIPSGRLIWRSRPRVHNAYNFELVGDGLLAGYGFTAEPDFLYVVDAATGAVRSEVRLKTAPEYILARGDTLHVRAYDTDYVFRLE